ncbi:hypothetical protein Thermo_01179 [Thermoplasmatales archaeon]|nr:hypothetical protein Thermo_01179 [Thermoplasmatales archaeon]
MSDSDLRTSEASARRVCQFSYSPDSDVKAFGGSTMVVSNPLVHKEAKFP